MIGVEVQYNFFHYYNLNSEWLLLGCLVFFLFHFQLIMSGISLAQEFRSRLLLSRRGNVTALLLIMGSLDCVGLLTWLVSLLFHIPSPHAIVFGFAVLIVIAILFFMYHMCTLRK